MTENTYFQFPLCALAFGKTEKERLNAIIDYGVVTAGWTLLNKLTEDEQRRFFSKQRKARMLPQGFSEGQWTHRAAVYGAEIIGVTLNSFLAGIERHDNLEKHIRAFEKAHGSDTLVRIKKSWLFKARDGRGLTYREFSVLCGIFSVIGEKDLARVTQPRIGRCALGYRTEAIMKAELPQRADEAQPLTAHPLRDTIDRLHRYKFFARCTVFRRLTYYSIRLDNEALRKAVLERRAYPDSFQTCRAAQDQALTEAIKRKRRETAKTEQKTPANVSLFKAWRQILEDQDAG